MAKSVKIYTTPPCPYCTRAKEFLKENNISFENIDVSADQAKAQEMINISGQMGVPVVVVDGEVIVGFDKDKIKKSLGI
ncbi:MAG: Uxx-star family glutaredoxin-like (seleno)protein [Candidatus Omnitrophota bacterium]